MSAADWIKLAGVIVASVGTIIGPSVYLAVRLAIRAEVDPLSERVAAGRQEANRAHEAANDAHTRIDELLTRDQARRGL